MKRCIALFSACILTASLLLAGCGQKAPETKTPETESVAASSEAVPAEAETETVTEPAGEAAEGTKGEDGETVIRLGGLKGATSIGMVKLISDAMEGKAESRIQFTMAPAADELTPLFIKGELDIMAVPANLGSVLYNKTEGNVIFAGISTLGVLSIVTNGTEEITELSQLAGKTILATGKGTTPEMTLTYLLGENGLTAGTDVTLEFVSEPTEIISAMGEQSDVIAMLPQPFATVAKTKVEGLRTLFDLTEEWDKLDNGSRCITAGLIVRRDWAEEHPAALAKFLEEYEASAEWINENPAEGGLLVEAFDIIKAPIAEKAIPFCNMTYIGGEEMKTALSGYLQVLADMNPQSVGGKLPGDDFYALP